ncbi:hypothetical protein D3C81_1990220 [compost metagenome]
MKGDDLGPARAQVDGAHHADAAGAATDQGGLSGLRRGQEAARHDYSLIGVDVARHVEDARIAHLAVDPDLERASEAQGDLDLGAAQLGGVAL